MRILFKYISDDGQVQPFYAKSGANIEHVNVDSDSIMVVMDNDETYVFETRAGDVEWDDLDENPDFEEEEDLTLEQVVEFLENYEAQTGTEELFIRAAVGHLNSALGKSKIGPWPPVHEVGRITYTNTANDVAHNHMDSKLTHGSLITKVNDGT